MSFFWRRRLGGSKIDGSRVSHHNFFFISFCGMFHLLPLALTSLCHLSSFVLFFYLPPTDSPKPFSKSNLNLSHSKQTTWHSTSKQAWFCRVPCYNGKTKIKTNKNYSSFQLIQYSRKEKNKQHLTNFCLGSYGSYILGRQFFNIFGNWFLSNPFH